MSKINVAVLFGGVSPEHEVSIITGIQILNAIDKAKYEVIPIYVTKDGKWVRGDASFFKPETFRNLEKAILNRKYEFISPDATVGTLVENPLSKSFLRFAKREKIDVVFPAFHGKYGEDGSVQGLLEMAGLPYVGCAVTASSVGMDKMITKRVAQSLGIPVLHANWVTEVDTVRARERLKYPVYVKPVHLGSSIGITRAENDSQLKEALEVGFFYDTKVMVEEGLVNAKEINISLLGNNPYKVSVCEQPVSTSEILSFKDKYISEKGESKGMATLKRIIPAPIKKETMERIEKYAIRFFGEIGGEGIVRMDFLLSQDEKEIYLNEINTMPGSVAFYLWKASGMDFRKLIDELIELAIKRQKRKMQLQNSFKSNILQGFGGAKTSKF